MSSRKERERARWERDNPVQGPPYTIIHRTGVLKVLPGGTAWLTIARLEAIDAEVPRRQREPRQQPGQPLPVPKRIPRYIGADRDPLRNQYFPNPPAEWQTASPHCLRPGELVIEETIGGEPWVAAYWRQFYAARDSGYFHTLRK